MIFQVSSSTLLKQLQLIGGVINSNNTLPILDNFLFELNDNILTISGTDLETTISTKIDVESSSKGSAAIGAKMLLDILKTFPEQPLNFILNEEKKSVEISSDYGKYSLAYLSAEEFPNPPEMDDLSKSEVSSTLLSSAINKSLFASGNDELRPIMTGVFFELSNSNLNFVATDAHKLVRYIRNDASSDRNTEFIVPKKPLNLLKNILDSLDTSITLEYNETNARFSFDGTQIICRLIDGKFPNYDAVIPKENPNKLTVDRSSFLSSVKRVSLFSNKTTHQVRLKVAGNELKISAEDLDFANKADERLTCQYEGEDIEIGFNSKFLVEMLSNLEAENVLLEMSSPNKAGLITPLDGTEEGEDILMLVMPVMLNN